MTPFNDVAAADLAGRTVLLRSAEMD